MVKADTLWPWPEPRRPNSPWPGSLLAGVAQLAGELACDPSWTGGRHSHAPRASPRPGARVLTWLPARDAGSGSGSGDRAGLAPARRLAAPTWDLSVSSLSQLDACWPRGQAQGDTGARLRSQGRHRHVARRRHGGRTCRPTAATCWKQTVDEGTVDVSACGPHLSRADGLPTNTAHEEHLGAIPGASAADRAGGEA